MADDRAPTIATRADAEAFLDSRIGQGVQPGLERISGLMAYLGDPQETYPSIHIAGTNGKTTVARMVQQILGAHGLATGGFTSPHLDTIEDRYMLHGARIDEEAFTNAVRDLAWFVEGYERGSGTPVTYFEVTAALAFSLFAELPVDVAIVEVGLGGRLDATNVLDADVSVITGIDMDHTEFLGDTIGAIAAEKAAIVKDGGTVVTGLLPGDALEAVEDRVAQVEATWVRRGRDFDVAEALVGVGGWQCSIAGVFGEYDELFLPIHGRHQVDNLATAIATAEMFLGRELDHELLLIAVASMRSPGRIEVVGRRPGHHPRRCPQPTGCCGSGCDLGCGIPADAVGSRTVAARAPRRRRTPHYRSSVASVMSMRRESPMSTPRIRTSWPNEPVRSSVWRRRPMPRRRRPCPLHKRQRVSRAVWLRPDRSISSANSGRDSKWPPTPARRSTCASRPSDPMTTI